MTQKQDPKATARKYAKPVVMIAAGAAMAAGVDFGPDAQAQMVEQVVQVVGAAMALYGSVRALYLRFVA